MICSLRNVNKSLDKGLLDAPSTVHKASKPTTACLRALLTSPTHGYLSPTLGALLKKNNSLTDLRIHPVRFYKRKIQISQSQLIREYAGTSEYYNILFGHYNVLNASRNVFFVNNDEFIYDVKVNEKYIKG